MIKKISKKIFPVSVLCASLMTFLFVDSALAVTKAILPPPKSQVKKQPITLTQEDRMLVGLMAVGIDEAVFSRDKTTYKAYYVQPAFTSAEDLLMTIVNVFTVLGTHERKATTFSVTPYGPKNDKPFVTFIASSKDVQIYLKGKMSLRAFLKTIRTKEDPKKYAKSCKATYDHSHEDASGICVCDAGYHLVDNEACIADPVADQKPPIQNPYVLPPVPPVVVPKLPVTPTTVSATPVSATLLQGRATLSASQFPGDGEGFSFDHGVSVRPHWYDFDLEFIFNDTYKNPTLSQSGSSGKFGFISSDVTFDQMTKAPSTGYCGIDVQPTSENDPCNSMSVIVGRNYYLKTASGGMVKNDAGQTIALGGKIRYAKIHIVSVSSSSVTFDWTFQTEEGNGTLH